MIIRSFLTLLTFVLGNSAYCQQVDSILNTAGNYTFQVPANVFSLTIECWGGGGGGGSTRARRFQSAGGGAGGSYIRHRINVTPGTIYNLTVGAGGTVTTTIMNPGGNSYFGNSAVGNPAGALVLAKGGNAATRPIDANGTSTSYLTTPGASSNLLSENIPTTGFLQSLVGNAGGNGTTASSGNGGAGGNGGTGGNSIAAAPALSTAVPGNPGTAPGGGGGGAINNNSATARAGGAGAAGRITISYFVCTPFSLTSTASSSNCQGTPATVNLSGTLPIGTYTVTYNLSGANVAAGQTASMTVTSAGSGSFNTNNLANAGNTTITVTALQSGTCGYSISTNNSATINVRPEAAISYPLPAYCAGTAQVIPVTQTGAIGGTYSASPAGLTINSSTGSINLSTSAAGTYTVSYTYSGACINVATTNITIHAIPVVTCPANMTTCLSTTPFALSGASPLGGTYSGPGVSGGSFNPASAGLGTHTITYSFTNANNCTSSCQFTITVVNSIPMITATPVSSVINTGGTAQINLSSTVVGTQYTWTASVTSGIVSGFSSQSTAANGPISQTLFNQGIGLGEVNYSITPTLTGCTGTPVNVVITLPATTFCQNTTVFQPGSCIINMGVTPQTQNNALRPYGLLYDLINVNNIPVYWAINPNKSFVTPLSKVDQVDFTVDGVNFRGGAFIIPAAIVPQVQTVINNWVAQGVVVHYASTSFSPPIYEIITRIPKVVLDADNGDIIETAFYTKAGIPTAAYTKGGIPSQINNCEDVYVLPHADPHLWSQLQKDSLLNFINSRGWFFSGCHAVSAIESNAGMRFLSNNGLVLWTNHVDPSPPYAYSLRQGVDAGTMASDPMMQFMGTADGALDGGSEAIYVPNAAGWRPTTRIAIYDSNYVNSGITYPNTAAAVAYGRAFGDPNKGIVMYVAGHSLVHGSNAEDMAAARLYANFLLRSGIGTRPRINPVSIPTSANAGDTVTLVVNVPTGISPIVSGQWSSDLNGTFLSQSTSTQFIVPSVDAATFCTVQYRVTDACGRVGIFCATITINPTIRINFIGAAQTICSSSIPATLTGTVPNVPNGAAFSYEWQMSTTNATTGFSAAPGTNNQQQYTPGAISQNTWFRRRVFTATGLSVVSSAIQITVLSIPVINTQPSSAGQTVCEGNPVTALSVSATGTGLTYQWYRNATASNSGGTLISGATGSSHTPSNALIGTNYYYCIVSNSNNCAVNSQVSGPVSITANPSITGQPSSADVTACQNASIAPLTVVMNVSNVTYQWHQNTVQSNTGGTAIPGATSASYTPNLVGSFYYYCVITSQGLCAPLTLRSNVSGLITILTSPTASIANNTGTSILTCLTTSISLTGSGGGTYSWSNGTGNVGTSANLNVTQPALYSLTVTAPNGCTANASLNITQNITAPTAGITNNSGTTELTCSQTSISVTATGGISYSWNNGLGSGATKSITSPGTYTVTVTGSNGCTSQSSVTITQNTTAPTAGISNNSGTTVLTCSQTSISVTATGGTSYSWDNGLGSGASKSITSPGTYTVTVTGSNGCTSQSSVTITQNTTAPTAGISNNSGTTVLTCSQTSISVTATGGTSYSWDNGLGSGATKSITLPGTYTVTVTGSNGCSSQASISITQFITEHTWIATPSSADLYWDNPLNWCGGIPTDSTDAYIPNTNATPSISRARAKVHNLRFDNGAMLNIDGDTLQVSGIINSNRNINATNGSVELTGTQQIQSISGNQFVAGRIKNLRLSNALGSQIPAGSDSLYITGLIDFGKANATLTTNGLLTLASGPAGTASVGNMSLYAGNRITGSVTVERYIPNLPKAWHFLSVPTNGQTIRQAWQEGNTPLGNSKPGFGTIITSNLATAGNMLGFDLVSPGGPSMKFYNPATNNWVGVSSTNTPIANNRGYMLFIRGDRSVTAFNQAATETRLRSSGQLYTPLDNPPSSVLVPAETFASVGNPYASAIDFSQLPKTGGLQDVFYVWDPQLTSSNQGSFYGFGSYRTFVRDGSTYKAIPPVTGGAFSNTNNQIPSGQAFFVRATGTAGTLSFTENAKTTVIQPVNRQSSPISSYLSINLSLISNNVPVLTDGLMMEFRQGYLNSLDALDALKMVNTGAENIGVLSNGKLLVAERRSLPQTTDTVFLQTGQLRQRNYQLEFQPENFPSGFQANLIDRFTQSTTPVNMLYDNTYRFTVTSDARSSSANRFMLVLGSGKRVASNTASIQLISGKKTENKGVELQWKASDNHPFEQFFVEKEINGTVFPELAPVAAGKGLQTNFSFLDEQQTTGKIRYRIRGVDAQGNATYSRTIELQDEKSGKNNVMLFPNPVQGTETSLKFEGTPEGRYDVSITGQGGQVVLRSTLTIANGVSIKKLMIDPSIPAGTYTLTLTGPDGKVTALPFIKL